MGDLPGPHPLAHPEQRGECLRGATEERQQRAVLVHDALRQLPTEQCELLTRVYFASQTQAEIATELAIPLSRVKTTLFRGLRQLALLLEPDFVSVFGASEGAGPSPAEVQVRPW